MKKGKMFSTAIVLVTIVFLLLPIIVTFIYSISSDWMGLVPKGLTLKNYIKLFGEMEFYQCIARTFILCIVPIGIMILSILLALYTVVIYFPKFEKYLQILCMIPYALQGVILSVSILSLYTGAPLFLSNRLFMLNGAYCIMILPYMYQGIRNSMNAINMRTLLEAAQVLGCSKLKAFMSIVVPNIMPGIITSSLLAFGIIFGDYVLVTNLVGNAFSNVQIYLYWQMRSSSTMGSAIFMVIFLVILIVTGLVLFFKSKDEAQRAEV